MAADLVVRSVVTHKAIRELAANIRAADRAEIEAMWGEDCDITAAIRAQVDSSQHPRIVLLDGKCVALYGCELTEYGAGCPWMLGARQLRKYPLLLHKTALEVVGDWRTKFRYLTNTVWSEAESIPWLRSLGFLISDTAAFESPETGEEFYYFFMGGI